MKRLMTILVTLAMLLTLLPASALAAVASTETFCSVTSSGKHSWGGWQTTKEATCTQTGTRVRVCGRCGYQQAETVKKAGHSWGKWKTVKEATCTAQGEQTRKCKVCGKKDTRKTDKAPHTWSEWTVITEPTDHSAGTRTRTCKVCGTEITQEFDPEGTLRRGDSGDAVKQLQEGLICYGVLTGRADGSFGPGTEKAVMAAQQAEGLTADGVAWPQTQARLGHRFGEWEVLSEKSDFSMGLRRRVCGRCGFAEDEEDWPEPIYRRGDKGDGVKALQEGLNAAGYDCGRADGDFGGRTERAVQAIETAHGVEADGIAWPGVQKWLTGAGSEEPDAESGLVLTVVPTAFATEGYMVGQEVSFDWTIANNREKDITLEAVYMDWGDEGMIGVNDAPVVLRANGGSASDTWTTALDAEWLRDGRFHMRFFGRGVEAGDPLDEHYIVSNDATFDLPSLPFERAKTDEGLDLISNYDNGDSAANFLDQIRNIGISLRNIPDPLVIVTQPAGGDIDPESGETLTLSVEASGGVEPYSYQWYRFVAFNEEAGRPMGHPVGDGEEEYPADAPGGYYCHVSDHSGQDVYSDVAEVTSQLYISHQPQNASLYGKESATLYCSATGGVPFDNGTYIYAWYNSADQQVGFADNGAVEVTEPGEYYCMVQDNGDGLVTSEKATVYDAEPLRCVSVTDTIYVVEPEPTEIIAEFSGGIQPYTAEWKLYDEVIPTTNATDIEFSATADEFGVYTCTVTDAVGNVAEAEVLVEYAQLEIAQQPVGGMLPQDGSGVPIEVVMAEGREPFSYTLYHAGALVAFNEDTGMSSGFPVYEPGYYFIHIEDADFRWATTEPVLVQDYEFYIDDLSVTGPLTGPEDTQKLVANVVGGEAPIKYRWWRKVGSDGDTYTDTMEPTHDISLPGEYYCEAEDNTGNVATSPSVKVEYTGDTPIITRQPQDVMLESKEVSAQLSCWAVSGSPTTAYHAPILYTWERKGESGWIYNREQGPTIPVTEPGIYRCICRDTYSGLAAISKEVTVSEKLAYSNASTISTGGEGGKWAFNFTGGMGPYTVDVYYVGHYGIPGVETVTQKWTTLIWDGISPITITAKPVISVANVTDKNGKFWEYEYMALYVEVWDKNGEKVGESPVIQFKG